MSDTRRTYCARCTKTQYGQRQCNSGQSINVRAAVVFFLFDKTSMIRGGQATAVYGSSRVTVVTGTTRVGGAVVGSVSGGGAGSAAVKQIWRTPTTVLRFTLCNHRPVPVNPALVAADGYSHRARMCNVIATINRRRALLGRNGTHRCRRRRRVYGGAELVDVRNCVKCARRTLRCSENRRPMSLAV